MYEYNIFIQYNNIFKFHRNMLHNIIIVSCITNHPVYIFYFINI